MADGLDGELRGLVGGGRRGAALSATRFVPPVAAGLSVPGALTGSRVALLVLLFALAVTVATIVVDARLRSRT